MADLAISYGVYNDGAEDHAYGYIGSGAYMEPGGDLRCDPCHTWFGPGLDPPNHEGDENPRHTRYYHERLELGSRADQLRQERDGKITGGPESRIREGTR